MVLKPYQITLGDTGLDCFPLEPGFARGAVVICPGGGYERLSDRESEPVARVFNRAGYHAFILRYAVAPAPLGYRPVRQLGRAVAYVRSQTGPLKLEPCRIAVCGFSAGGHLAASLGVMWHRPACFPGVDDLEAQRPDALILCYPVISAGRYAHQGSFRQLAGDDRADWSAFSVEEMVDVRTPPAFLWHTAADPTVPAQNSIRFASALLEQGVPVELHLYPFGTHGLSLATPDVAAPEENRFADSHVASWFSLAARWLDTIV